MKIPTLLALAGLLAFTGCSTTSSISKAQGHGIRRTYDVDYDTAYNASRAAAMMDELDVIRGDHQAGFIHAHRPISAESFGENIGIWVHKVGPAQTEVEVVSRSDGPAIHTARQREDKILERIAMLLQL